MPRKLSIDLRWIDSSGVGVYIKGIMPGLIEALSDHSVVGIGQESRIREFSWSSADNFSVIPCSAGRYSLREQFELPRLIPRDTDLFFSPYYTIPMLYRGKTVVTVHDLGHFVHEEITSNVKKRVYAQWMYKALVRRASLILTVSEFTKRELIRYTGYPAEKILPTPLGISPDWYQAGVLPADRLRPYFVVVGNVKPYKNLSRLVEAFLSIRHEVPHDLVIVGQSEGMMTGESPDFFQMVQSASDRIQMMGKVPYRQLLSMVGHAEALVMPSLYEGFGLPPVEAMAAGVPALVSTAGSLPEVCGESALYFDPFQTSEIASALLRIAKDPALRESLSQAGRAWSRRYRWDLCAEQTAAALLHQMV